MSTHNIHFHGEIKIFYLDTVLICSLPLNPEGQLSVSGEGMCTILVNCLEV